jgi:hypothetical protein
LGITSAKELKAVKTVSKNRKEETPDLPKLFKIAFCFVQEECIILTD